MILRNLAGQFWSLFAGELNHFHFHAAWYYGHRHLLSMHKLSLYKPLKLDLNCIARHVERNMCQHTGGVLGMAGNIK